jgi:hypothetical protein
VRTWPTPCENSLSAMLNDSIKFFSQEGIPTNEVVLSMGWQPAPKGGKIWSYYTSGGNNVPHTDVVEVIRNQRGPIPREAMQSQPGQISNDKIEGVNNIENKSWDDDVHRKIELIPPEIYLRQELMAIADSLNLQSTYKVVLSCILEGDVDSIQVAADLLKIRARQLRELSVANGFDPNQSTTNPLKEDEHGK